MIQRKVILSLVFKSQVFQHVAFLWILLCFTLFKVVGWFWKLQKLMLLSAHARD